MDAGIESYRRFLAGDETGLEQIVRLYSDGLMQFINQVVKDEAAAEDLMEDTFAELVAGKNKFREEASLKTWLYKIGRNKALNYVKKHARISDIPIQQAVLAREIPNSPSLEEVILKKEEAEELHKAMEKLRMEYQEILYLLYFEEMSYEQIGKVLKKSNKQIKNLAYRSRQSLKEILERGEFVYEKL